MLDIILIQDIKTGINLVEFQQIETKFNSEHSEIFGGFMSAIQSITVELDIGQVVLIATKGTKGHNCIVTHKKPIDVIILADQDDPIEVWQEQGEIIAEEFIKRYGKLYHPSIVSKFKEFRFFLEELCSKNKYCE